MTFLSALQVTLSLYTGGPVNSYGIFSESQTSVPHSQYVSTLQSHCTEYSELFPSTPGVLDNSVPQILINREPLPNMTFDIQLLGYSDTIVGELCQRLGKEWVESVRVVSEQKGVSFSSPEAHTHIFAGAVWKAGHNTVTTTARTADPEPNTQHATCEPNGHILYKLSNASTVPGTCSHTYPCSEEHTREPDSHPCPPSGSTPSLPVSSPSSGMPAITAEPSLPLPDDNTPPTKRLRVNPDLCL